MKDSRQNLLLAITQSLNAIAGGSPQESFSSRCYRNRSNKLFNAFRKGINKLFFWQEDHCERAYYFELKRVEELSRLLGEV